MKKYILASLLFIPFSGWGQQPFTMEGKITNKKTAAGKKVYYMYYNGETNITDSAEVKRKRFEINGEINGATLLQIGLGSRLETLSKEGELRAFFIGPGTQEIVIRKNLKTARIKGSEVYDESVKYQNLLKETDSLIARANGVMRDTTVAMGLRQEMMQVRSKAIKERQDLRLHFIKTNPSSPFAIRALRDFAGVTINAEVVEPVFNLLDPAIRTSEEGRQFAERIRIARNTSVGSHAPDFEMEDVDGHLLRLSDFRGKYVLLDFWASWCMPCRAEHPYLREVYARYKDKGFEIFAVSLDQEGKKNAWINAIKKDQITWPQVSDLQFYNNKAAVLYGINAIPQNFLLDKEGKIIAKNLRGQALERFLKILF